MVSLERTFEQSSTREFMSELPRGFFNGYIGMDAKGCIGRDAKDFANFAFLDRLPDLDAEREISRPDRVEQEPFLFLGSLVQKLGLRCVDGQGFLADNVLARLESQHCMLEVVRMRTGDVDNVDTRVCHKVLVRAVSSASLRDVKIATKSLGAIFAGS
jgi:hypothetical protein